MKLPEAQASEITELNKTKTIKSFTDTLKNKLSPITNNYQI